MSLCVPEYVALPPQAYFCIRIRNAYIAYTIFNKIICTQKYHMIWLILSISVLKRKCSGDTDVCAVFHRPPDKTKMFRFTTVLLRKISSKNTLYTKQNITNGWLKNLFMKRSLLTSYSLIFVMRKQTVKNTGKCSITQCWLF